MKKWNQGGSLKVKSIVEMENDKVDHWINEDYNYKLESKVAWKEKIID